MLICVSYSVNNCHVVAVVLQEWGNGAKPVREMRYFSICTMGKVWKVHELEFHTPSWELCGMAWLFCILCTVQA